MIDLVAAVGLWLAAPWGAVVWLTSVISWVAVEMIFPQVYGGSMWTVGIEAVFLAIYLWLALQARARAATIKMSCQHVWRQCARPAACVDHSCSKTFFCIARYPGDNSGYPRGRHKHESRSY